MHEQLLNDVLEIKHEYDEEARKTGVNFNIFDIINLRTEEVRLHSKFLAELLNPYGTHGQSDKFLRLFVEECGISGFDTRNAKVYIEEFIGQVTDETGGRLDICIKGENNKAIVIENKINAKDQDNQLVRYHNFLKNKCKSSIGNLLYLNLYGNEPSENSCENLTEGKDYKIISYQNNIVKWLQQCIDVVEYLPLLKEGIIHYLNLIKSLTGQSINEAMNKEITDVILSDAKKVESALQISTSIEEIKIKLQLRFWKELKNAFESKSLNVNAEDCFFPTEDNVRSFYSGERGREKYLCYSIEIYRHEEVGVNFKIEIDAYLNGQVYYGFEIVRYDVRGNSVNKSGQNKYSELRDVVHEIVANDDWNEYWLGYRRINEDLTFCSFNSEIMYSLGEDEYLENLVASIVESCVKDINVLKTKLEKLL